MCSTLVGLQGVQIQLVPDRGGEVGGLPWHYAVDKIVGVHFYFYSQQYLFGGSAKLSRDLG